MPRISAAFRNPRSPFFTRAIPSLRFRSSSLIHILPNLRPPLEIFRLGDISNEATRGHYHRGTTAPLAPPAPPGAINHLHLRVSDFLSLGFEGRRPWLFLSQLLLPQFAARPIFLHSLGHLLPLAGAHRLSARTSLIPAGTGRRSLQSLERRNHTFQFLSLGVQALKCFSQIHLNPKSMGQMPVSRVQ